MNAIILAGGYGTRLRPLSFSKPKPLVEFMNEPMIAYQIRALKNVGVKKVIIAISYLPEQMNEFAKVYSDILDIDIECVMEDQPLGTGGAIRNATRGLNERVFVLNSDVICDYKFEKMLDFHKQRKALATIMTTKVENPSQYGVVLSDTDGFITKFVEKPIEYVGNDINAGVYIIEPSFYNNIPDNCSVEKDVFPIFVEKRTVLKFQNNGFWMDVGKPIDFLEGGYLVLKHRNVDRVVGDNVSIGEDVKFDGNVVVGSNVHIGKGVYLRNCVIMDDVRIEDYCVIQNSIIGWRSKIGRWSHVDSHSVLGEGVIIKERLNLKKVIALPFKGITQDCTDTVVL
jgi:mannose-1-phosphate guanylyltransferase